MARSLIFAAPLLLTAACSLNVGDPEGSIPGVGGAFSSGGSSTAGGSTGVGGSVAAGGSSTTGGTGAGASDATGGGPAAGGSGVGGSGVGGSGVGGAYATGGGPAAGGSGVGGSFATGGGPATGGTAGAGGTGTAGSGGTGTAGSGGTGTGGGPGHGECDWDACFRVSFKLGNPAHIHWHVGELIDSCIDAGLPNWAFETCDGSVYDGAVTCCPAEIDATQHPEDACYPDPGFPPGGAATGGGPGY